MELSRTNYPLLLDIGISGLKGEHLRLVLGAPALEGQLQAAGVHEAHLLVFLPVRVSLGLTSSKEIIGIILSSTIITG